MGYYLNSSTDELRNWFARSGVEDPLRTCIGPLPQSRAALGRWASSRPDSRIHSNIPHPDCYRLVLLMAPLEARIWNSGDAIWGGMIASSRFRICAPNEIGSWSRASACDIVNLFIPKQFVEQLACLRGESQVVSLNSTLFTYDKTVFELVQTMLDAETLSGPLVAQVCDSAMLILVSYLLEHYSKPIDAEQSAGISWRRLRKVLAYIETHLETLPSNVELAAMCGMSEAYFSREFRRAVGQPPHQYMMKKRIESASQLLLSGEHRVVDIAHEFGFNDASHFTRSFCAQFGMTPAQYKQKRCQTSHS
ncbi:MAG: AraC family transcriptional regulator [Undibacterium sp.]|nr:AraC family transcriptional regulator [Undibacterium sp.]